MIRLAIGILALSGWISDASAQQVRAAGSYWDWQLTSPIDLDVEVKVLVLDASEVSAADIERVERRGVKTVCYVSVGTLEEYRDDLAAFPAAVVGKTYGDWPDERFLDIRARDVLMPIMRARFQLCADLGFDAIEPDNMSTYDNDTGFELTQRDQLVYNLELAAMAHEMGLEIAQKNAVELLPAMYNFFDFMIVEECFLYQFCNELQPYLDAGKDVLAAEYPITGVSIKEVCAYAESSEIKFIFKAKEITAGYLTC